MNYGTSPCLMRKSTINRHFQQLCTRLATWRIGPSVDAQHAIATEDPGVREVRPAEAWQVAASGRQVDVVVISCPEKWTIYTDYKIYNII